jgi:microcystin degradation protein MlrC
MRIAIGGFQHESHSFAPLPATYADFVKPGGFPGLSVGAAMLDVIRGASVPAAGAMAAAEAAGTEIVPLAWTLASPSAPVQDEAFERITALMCAELSRALDAGKLDGVYLDLHGAGVNESFPDLEGEVLRRVRAIVGSVPIAISVDPHCNLTQAMVSRADVVVPYRTYPHVDMVETGARAMRLLLAMIRDGKRFEKAFRQLDYWLPITTQCTLVEPMLSVMAERAALEARAGLAELAFCFGFPYADFADCGAAVAAYGDTEADAAAAADKFIAFLRAQEGKFRLDVLPAADAVARAKTLSGESNRPIVIADTQDNPGGGGHGDTTGLLGELVRQSASDAVLGLINDAESAASCHAAGVGARVELALGGKSDGAPLLVRATVHELTDGRFVLTGPMSKGNQADLGPTALIEIEPGIRVIVVTRKMQAYDQALFRHVGIEPAACGILALKSSVHFRADFQPIAEAVIVAAAPGPVVADPATLPFKHVRPGVRMRPMSNAV